MKRLIAAILVAGVVGMGLFLFRRTSKAPEPPGEEASRDTHFVFAKVIDPIDPFERDRKYEQPLARALEQRNYGEITGGGTSQAKDGRIEWVGIDLELVNLKEALQFTRSELRKLGAPAGSVLEYTENGQNRELPIHPR